MTHDQSLLDFLRGLVGDGASRARFSADPDAALFAGGVVATSPQDVHDALVRIGDDEDLGRGFGGGRARATDVVNVPPPPPPEYFGERDPHRAAVHYLDNYVSSNFDDDLGPFTGSSAEHAAVEESLRAQVGDDDGLYSDSHGADDYSSHEYSNSHADGGPEPAQHHPEHYQLDQHSTLDTGGL